MLSGRKIEISRPKNARHANRNIDSELIGSVKGCELNAFTLLPNSDLRTSMPALFHRQSSSPDEDSNDENGSVDGVKTRIISIWNQVKYGWMVKVKNNFHLESPIWLLGVCYCKESKAPGLTPTTESTGRRMSIRTLRSNSITSNSEVQTQIANDRKQLLRVNSVLTQSSDSSSSLCPGIDSTGNYISPFESTPSVQARLYCSESSNKTLEKFKHDFFSRIWMTYRREFPKIIGSNFTSDCGWGCMLRSAQMLMAQALICHFLNRSWRWTGARSDKEDMIHRMLIKWFADDSSAFHCPFSIHQMVKHGTRIGKKPGDWYGPASAAYILRESLKEASETNFVLDGLCVYVAQDCTINLPDLIQLCTEKSNNFCSPSNNSNDFRQKNFEKQTLLSGYGTASSGSFRRKCRNSLKSLCSSFELATASGKELIISKQSNLNHLSHSSEELATTTRWPLREIDSVNNSSIGSRDTTPETPKEESRWKAVIILIPLRLGGEKFNTIYTECVHKLFCTPLCVGMIGGKPKHSMYFVGCQDDKLICLDPHYSQDTVDVVGDNNFPLDSYHCSTTRKLSIHRMDPSCTIAFYCKTRDDLNNLIEFTRSELRPQSQGRTLSEHPIFSFEEMPHASSGKTDRTSISSGSSAEITKNLDKNVIKCPNLDVVDSEKEDFVIL